MLRERLLVECALCSSRLPVPMTGAEIVQYLKDHAPLSSADVTRISSGLVGDVTGTIHRVIRAFAPQTAEDILDEWFPWTRDQRLAMDSSISEEDRMAAINRLASTVRWSTHPGWGERERGAWRELRARVEDEQRPLATIKQEVLDEAVVLVLGDRDRLQRIRVGRGLGSFSLRENEDADTKVRPRDLPYSADPGVTGSTSSEFNVSPYLYWFRREVQEAATAILLGEPYPPPAVTEDVWKQDRSYANLDELQNDEANPLLHVTNIENYQEQMRTLAPILEAASPRQQDLLLLLADGATTAEAARALGIAESTARVQIKRLRDKVAPV